MVYREEEQQIEKAVALLSAKLLGTVLGFLCGTGLFLATLFLVVKGGENVGQHLNLLGQFFPGYRVSYPGSIIGFLYGFVTGFVVGAVLGGIYNRVARALTS